MAIPRPDPLDEYHPALADMVARTSWLPDPKTVEKLGEAVFPTSRAKRHCPGLSHAVTDDVIVGMYDDNTTPEWAIFWSHGLSGSRPKGWTIAHVWPACDDIRCYTHLANLAMVREPFASLTDKDGPLTRFLRWHAWHVYHWKPERLNLPTKPDGYDSIQSRYLEQGSDPRTLIQQRMARVKNQRSRILRPIMERQEPL